MTKEEKRIKILKRDDYKKELKENNKSINYKTFLLGFSALVSILCFSTGSTISDSTRKWFYQILGAINSLLGIYHLKNLIETICNKIMLKGKIDDIDTLLAINSMQEIEEENKVLKKW